MKLKLVDLLEQAIEHASRFRMGDTATLIGVTKNPSKKTALTNSIKNRAKYSNNIIKQTQATLQELEELALQRGYQDVLKILNKDYEDKWKDVDLGNYKA